VALEHQHPGKVGCGVPIRATTTATTTGRRQTNYVECIRRAKTDLALAGRCWYGRKNCRKWLISK